MKEVVYIYVFVYKFTYLFPIFLAIIKKNSKQRYNGRVKKQGA